MAAPSAILRLSPISRTAIVTAATCRTVLLLSDRAARNSMVVTGLSGTIDAATGFVRDRRFSKVVRSAGHRIKQEAARTGRAVTQ